MGFLRWAFFGFLGGFFWVGFLFAHPGPTGLAEVGGNKSSPVEEGNDCNALYCCMDLALDLYRVFCIWRIVNTYV